MFNIFKRNSKVQIKHNTPGTESELINFHEPAPRIKVTEQVFRNIKDDLKTGISHRKVALYSNLNPSTVDKIAKARTLAGYKRSLKK